MTVAVSTRRSCRPAAMAIGACPACASDRAASSGTSGWRAERRQGRRWSSCCQPPSPSLEPRKEVMTDGGATRILTVDDHPLVRAGLVTIIGKQPDIAVIAEAATGHEGIEQFRTHRPDVTLMDLRLPDMSGVDTTIAIRSEFPDARIVALTTFEGDVDIQRAFAAGVKAYVLKNMPPKDLMEIIRHVHAGQKRVAPEVARLRGGAEADKSRTP